MTSVVENLWTEVLYIFNAYNFNMYQQVLG